VLACATALLLLGVLAPVASAAPPANDNFTAAASMPGWSSSTTGTNLEATKELGEPNHNGNAGGASVWYSWTATATGTASIDTLGSSFDTILAIYTGGAVGSLVPVVANDDAAGSSQSRVTFAASSGTTYRIAVEGYNAATGNVQLYVNRPPLNDPFGSARSLVGSNVNVTGSNIAGSIETGEPMHAGNMGGASVWYVWTAPGNGQLTLDTAGSTFDTLLAAYTGVSVNALTVSASNDDDGASQQSRVQFTVASGTTYRFAVDGRNGATGDLALALAFVADPPPNDNFAAAAAIASNVVASGTTLGATAELGEPTHAGVAGGRSVWWTWTATQTSRVTIDTTGSTIDTLLAAYSGAAVGALAQVAANDDISGAVLQSSASFVATSGTTYRFAVDGKAGAQGAVALQLLVHPVNDDFAASIPVSGASSSTSGTNSNGTSEAGEPNPLNSVWYSWTAPTTGTATVQTCGGAAWDTWLAVYTGASVGALTLQGADDNACGAQSRVSFAAVGGTTYHVQVRGNGGTASGAFTLAWSIPFNDDFAAALPVTTTFAQVTGWNGFATAEIGEPAHAGVAGGRSLWWTWTPGVGGTCVVRTTGAMDTLLGIYTGTSVGALTPVASNDDDGALVSSRATFTANASTTYAIAVDGKAGATGSIALTLACPPANDDFANATVLSGFGGSITTTNDAATAQASEPQHANVAGGTSLWYAYTPAWSGTFTATTSATSVDTLLGVYVGPGLGGLVPLAANDDDGAATTSRVSLAMTAGNTYWIAVDGKAGASGPFTFNWSIRAANDDFANAVALTTASGSVSGFTQNSTSEPSEPNGQYTVWYAWTAPASGAASFQTCGGASWDTWLAVYSGSALNALTTLGTSDDNCGAQSIVNFTAVGGSTYYVQMRGYGGNTGTFTLSWNVPFNDDFANAIPVASAGFITSGYNPTATRQAGEPNHAGATGGRSLWWNFTPPTSGTCFVATSGSLDTVVGVYTGTSVNALTLVVANDDDGAGPSSRATWTATGGTTYRIAVDDKGSGGSFGLTMSCPPSNDMFATPTALAGMGPSTTNSTSAAATFEAGEPQHAGVAGGASVWFTWTAPMDGQLQLNTTGSGFDTLLAVYTGAAVNALTQVMASDDDGALTTSRLAVTVTSGTTYRIAIDGRAGAAGAYTLALALRPVNDNFVDSTTLTGASGSIPGSTINSTNEPGEPNPQYSVWYSWTSPATGNATVQTCGGAGWDTWLAVYSGSAVNSLTQLGANDDGCGAQSTVTFAATGGTTYRIQMRGYGGNAGNFTLAWSVPFNNDLAAATAISGTNVSTVAWNTMATMEAGEPAHAGDAGGGHSLWWAFTPGNSGACWLTTGGAIDTAVGVYTGTSMGSLALVAANDDDGALQTSRLMFSAVLGTTYRIAVDSSGSTGTFTLTIACRPINDDLSGAIAIAGTTGSVTANSTYATAETSEPNHAGVAGGSSLWYSFTAPTNGTLELATAGSAVDTLLATYTGATISTLVARAANDDDGAATTSRVKLQVTSGTTYLIAVDGKAAAQGALTLAWWLRPANDDFANGTVIAGNSGSIAGTNVNATSEPGEPNPQYTVWYFWTAPAAGNATFETCGGAGWDTWLAVYSGSAVGALTQLGASDDGCGAQSTVTIAASAGTTYRVQMRGYSGNAAAFTMFWRFSPANDAFASAQVLTGYSATASGNTSGASLQAGEPNHAGAPGGASVWYSWTPAYSGSAVVDTLGSGFDTLVGIYTGASVSALTTISGNDNFGALPQSRATFSVTSGTTYYIAVDGYSGATGAMTVTVNRPPTNDNFAAARSISGSGATISGSSIGATAEASEPAHAASTAARSIWYSWQPTVSGPTTINTVGTAFDTVLGVYTGASLATLTQVAANDDGVGLQSTVTFMATAGTTYWVAIDGKAGASGDVTLQVVAPLGVTGSLPNVVVQGATSRVVRVQGSGFKSGATAAISGAGITILSTTFSSTGELVLVVAVDPAAPRGARDVTVTNPDTASATGVGILAVEAASSTIAITGLGYDDTAPDSTPPIAIGFGGMLPGTVKQIGPAGTGQAAPNLPAVSLAITANTTWQVTATSADWTSGADSLPVANTAWRQHGTSGAWTPFTTSAVQVASGTDPVTTTIAHDLQVTMPANQAPGTYTTSITYTVIAVP
jgi:hypothetical protein